MSVAIPSRPTLRFGRIAPTLPVTDIDRALAFYVDVLGFTKTFENGTPVGFVILKKDAAELHLSLHPAHKPSTQNLAHLLVDDATALHDHLDQAGIRIIKSLRDADYGLRGFVFADQDGNRIDVGQRL
ncbi:VOC family protein [Pseudoxanthomonas sp.]|uniref:VOC family protein n=1 Tax=Pseudoxanthomonas sp. TaxID=1871049 RepID=UPI00261AB8C1|nr:VOC family protein [Pseudoxanthomonas sp.]WDS35990.1 MAG: VOC family protein [Pseudoxanthomonas sp.]